MTKIRKSANGEDCQMRLPGICTHDPATTIWSHARWGSAGRGKSIKALDEAGAYTCTRCDAAYDGQLKTVYTRDQIDADWCQAHFRSLVILKQKGLI